MTPAGRRRSEGPTIYRSAADDDYLNRWQRILVIDRRLREGAHPNASSLATECGVSRRTIVRDLEALRILAAAPIVYDASHRGYRYAGQAFSIPLPLVSPEELVALRVARSCLTIHAGSAWAAPVDRALERILQFLPPGDRDRLERAARAIDFEPPLASRADPGVATALLLAIADRERVRLHIRDGAAPGPIEVDPLRVLAREHRWELRALAPGTDQPSSHPLDSIESVVPLGPAARRRSPLLPASSLAPDDPPRPIRVELLFHPAAAHLVDAPAWRDDADPSPDRALVGHADGSVTLRCQIRSPRRLERMVLALGGAVAIVRPRRLRLALADCARRILQEHDRRP